MKNGLFILSLALVMFGCGDDPIVDTSSNNLVDITSEMQFNQEVGSGVSLVFYHASWCSKCAAQRPAVEALTTKMEFDGVFFAEVEFEDFSDIVTARNVQGFPTVVIYKDNIEQKRFTGQGHSEEELQTALKAAL